MEFKEYLKIISADKHFFWGVIFFLGVAFPGFFFFRPDVFDVHLGINVTRLGIQDTADYRYDEFYRLQADEKFAETLVEWIKSPRTAVDVLGASGLKGEGRNLKSLSGFFSAEKRSSQIVSVRFSSSIPAEGQKISENLSLILKEKTEKLNEFQEENSWFALAVEEPVIVKRGYHYGILFLGGLGAGLFLAFWTVMFRHYLRTGK